MLKLMIFLVLLFGVQFSSNAAAIIDNSLMAVDKKKERLELIKKTVGTDFLTDHSDEVASEYEAELMAVLKKNTIKHEVQGNQLNPKHLFFVGSGIRQFIQGKSRDEIDAQSFLETEKDWLEIKGDLKKVSIFWSALNSRVSVFFDEYLNQDINTDLFFGSNIKGSGNSGRESNYNKNIFSNVAYKSTKDAKVGYLSNKTPENNNDELTNVDVRDGDNKIGDEGKILSIIYLWKIYSDTIVSGLSIIAILWLIIASLIKFLRWNAKGIY